MVRICREQLEAFQGVEDIHEQACNCAPEFGVRARKLLGLLRLETKEQIAKSAPKLGPAKTWRVLSRLRRGARSVVL